MNSGMMAIRARQIAPANVIRVKIVSTYSAVLFPGRIPGINPPYFRMLSATLCRRRFGAGLAFRIGGLLVCVSVRPRANWRVTGGVDGFGGRESEIWLYKDWFRYVWELSFVTVLCGNQRSLLPAGQSVALEMVLSEAEDAEKRAQETQN
jgi:hypothetical protein